MRSNPLAFFDDHSRGQQDGSAAEMKRTRASMTASLGRRIGVGLTERNLIRRYTELRCGDLCESGFVSLPVGLGSNRQHRASILRECDPGSIRWRTKCRLEVISHPDTAACVPFLRLLRALWKSAHIRKLDRALQHRVEIADVDFAPERGTIGKLIALDQVFLAQFDRRDPCYTSRDIDRAF